ncbi:DUF6634 family protein [Methylobacterium sp. 092160098-2]|uniref:DUF6634 family protein n=1 Tax=Methylobacterium sp. 092160098-2 TaxID=3025129 RepID=UPI003158EE95
MKRAPEPVRTASEAAIEAACAEVAGECVAGPSPADLDAAPFLQDWSLCRHPDVGGCVLTGRVFGHPAIVDGTRIHTSHVAVLDEEGGRWARTISRYYLLGRPEGETIH